MMLGTALTAMKGYSAPEVEQTYESRADEELGCINPEFSELPVGEPTFRVIARITPG